MFGDNLKRYRTEKGLSQNELAKKLYVTRQCVSKWEKGTTQPDLHTLLQLSELLNVTVDELIKETDDGESKKRINGNLYFFIINTLLCVFCSLAFIALWRFMPERIPAHWNSHGTIDRYGSRNEIFLHLVSVVTFYIVDIISYLVLNKISDKRAVFIAHGTVIVFQFAYLIFIAVLYFRYISNLFSFTTCLSADLIACISVFIHPKINKQNKLIGVRTYETLNSSAVWHKANALASLLFLFSSLTIFIVNLIIIFDLCYLCLLAYIVPTVAVIIYSKCSYAKSDIKK